MNIFGTSFNYQARIDKIRKRMEEQDIDCLFVHNWVNQYYISGFYQHLPWYPVYHRSAGEAPLILFQDPAKEPVFLCAFLTHKAVKEGTWIEDVRIYDRGSTQGVYESIAAVLKEEGVARGKIGIEEDCLTTLTFGHLEEALPEAKFVHAANILKFVRTVKEPEEIELIKEAVSIAESALKVAMDVAKPGVTEMEVQRAVEREMKRRGGFREVETMCQSGPRTANYRAFAANWKKIGENELVMVDLGCLYNGYGCDISRTWIVGTATKEQRQIARDLYRLFEKVIAFVKPGLTYREVIDFGRKELKEAGYLSNNLHFPFQQFGIHGIGLGPFHEPPDAEFKEMVLEPGMALAIQHAVREESFTIRFEDDVVVRPQGLELLSTFPRELI